MAEDGELGHRGRRRYPAPSCPATASTRRRARGIEIRQAAASPEEAAAIAAAMEQFLRDTAPAPAADGQKISPWLRAALFENAGLAGRRGPSPWGDPEPWGPLGSAAR